MLYSSLYIADIPMARLNSKIAEEQRQVEGEMDTGQAGQQILPEKAPEEALEDQERIVQEIPNGTNTFRESSALLTQNPR